MAVVCQHWFAFTLLTKQNWGIRGGVFNSERAETSFQEVVTEQEKAKMFTAKHISLALKRKPVNDFRIGGKYKRNKKSPIDYIDGGFLLS